MDAQEFNPEITFVPGKDMIVADFWSRVDACKTLPVRKSGGERDNDIGYNETVDETSDTVASAVTATAAKTAANKDLIFAIAPLAY